MNCRWDRNDGPVCFNKPWYERHLQRDVFIWKEPCKRDLFAVFESFLRYEKYVYACTVGTKMTRAIPVRSYNPRIREMCRKRRVHLERAL